MIFENFGALEAHLSQLFQNKHYAQALDLVTREGLKFPAERVWVDYWRMCAAARLQNNGLVFQIAEAALEDGLWYGEMLWRTTPSFAPLQGDSDFERIVSASRAAQEADAPAGRPALLVHLPENHADNSPLLVALHGNETSAAQTFSFWNEAVSQGWVLALPQSDQVLYKGGYVWNDVDTAFDNIQAHFNQLSGQIAFDRERVVIAGHSLGSWVAIQMALSGALKVRGFIAIGPVIPYQDEPEKLEAILSQLYDRDLCAYLIVGEKDELISSERSQAFCEVLGSTGILCQLEIVPDATHDCSPAYDAPLRRALAFMNS